MGDDEIRGSRFRRAATITGTAAGVAAREATARAMTKTAGSSDARRAAASRQQMKSAHSLLRVFAGMSGAAHTWFDIAREWFYGDAPTTDLGRAEKAFFGTRHTHTTGAMA